MSLQSKKIEISLQNSPHHVKYSKSNELKPITNNSDDFNAQSDAFSTISNLLDNLNKNSLNIFYQNSTSIFKKKIDELNLKFYLETEKYLSNKKTNFNCQNTLFIILFKQISLYIDEIQRLNVLIQEKKFEPRNIKERTEEIIKKSKEFETKEQLIKTLKESKANIENKLLEVIGNEDRLRMENEKLRKENESLKDQLGFNNSNLKGLTEQIEQFHYNPKQIIINANNTIKTSVKTPIVTKQRNHSDSNQGSHKKNNFSESALYSKPKKEIRGLIKSVKEKLIRTSSNEYKVKSSGSIASPQRYCHSPTVSPEHEPENSKYKSSKEIGHVKTELIISNLEDYAQTNSNKMSILVESNLSNGSNHHLPYMNSKRNSNNVHNRKGMKKYSPYLNIQSKRAQINI